MQSRQPMLLVLSGRAVLTGAGGRSLKVLSTFRKAHLMPLIIFIFFKAPFFFFLMVTI